jgi:hypothetical protein
MHISSFLLQNQLNDPEEVLCTANAALKKHKSDAEAQYVSVVRH